jgi:adenylate cyclase, class 2
LSIETEVKIKIEDPVDFCRRMTALKPEILSARHFEDNILLDFPDQKLSLGRCLLRVRLTEKQSYLTFKGPARQDGIFKTREELETCLDNGPAMLQVLNRIGMHVCFQYQKYRQEFGLDGIHVAVDETPIGNYVELEGSEERIRNLAHKMGIAETQFLRSSYYSLYVEHCQAKGETPKFMIF